MLGKLHADNPSIDDAALGTAMASLDQLDVHNDRYIAMKPITSLPLPTQHHQHIVTIP